MSTFLQGSNSLFRGLAGLWTKITGSGLTPAERQAQDFSAQQAEASRSFQSAEADKARQWQEEYYTQFQSPAAMIRQYEDAGLNPALLYGNGASSSTPPSTAVPSGAAASSGMPSSGESLLSFISSLVTAKSVINKNNAEANLANSNASEVDQRVEWNPQRWLAEINERDAHRDNMLAGVDLLRSQVSQVAANIRLTEAEVDKVLADTDNALIDKARKQLEVDGARITNEKLAAQVVQVYAEARLASAQTLLSQSNSRMVDLQSFVQELDNVQAAASGGSRATSFYGLLDKFASGVVVEGAKLSRALKLLWDKIF